MNSVYESTSVATVFTFVAVALLNRRYSKQQFISSNKLSVYRTHFHATVSAAFPVLELVFGRRRIPLLVIHLCGCALIFDAKYTYLTTPTECPFCQTILIYDLSQHCHHRHHHNLCGHHHLQQCSHRHLITFCCFSILVVWRMHLNMYKRKNVYLIQRYNQLCCTFFTQIGSTV